MKTLMKICVGAMLLIATAPAMAAMYVVDIGTPTSESGYNLVSWGPIEPTTHGGSWGGISTDPLSYDGLCRVIWDASDDDPSASLTFPEPINSVTIRYLLGYANDSYNVNVYGSGQLWGSVSYPGGSTEIWVTTTFTGSPGTTLTLTATGQAWASFNTYGQVAIDRIEAVPAPAAILLGILGLGAAGLKLRRFA